MDGLGKAQRSYDRQEDPTLTWSELTEEEMLEIIKMEAYEKKVKAMRDKYSGFKRDDAVWEAVNLKRLAAKNKA